ncbi:hypothetical protein SCHPADRAFT_994490 [Schizopora paradoxa]|uniref:RRM domain-containing protein n=1 Tax=Schizopora paradoxa TaxID=27342 RepID=A0A0H2S024_9AGAM|nr:hypothetical protein SCHPADRAFT_994490 [Schizopora paradoxa]
MSSTDVNAFTIHVSGISPQTTKEHLHDFFAFCGTIAKIDLELSEKEQVATIHFEKHSAAKTAVMLNGGTLDGAHLTVKELGTHGEEIHEDTDAPPEGVPFHQSDKPRAAIAAEYLAAGYKLTDDMTQSFIDMDNKHGISKRFTSWFDSINKGVGAKVLGNDQTVTSKVQSTLVDVTASVRGYDEQKGISKAGKDYYEKALQSKWGSTIFSFYTTTAKQVTDVHAEAMRIKEAKKGTTATSPTSAPATNAPGEPAAPSAAAPLAL